jgi:hypothetical protein
VEVLLGMEVASWQDWPKLDVKWDDEGPTELRTDRRPKSKLDWFRKQGDSQRISQPHDQAGGARVEVEALDAKPRNATRCACGLDDGTRQKALGSGPGSPARGALWGTSRGRGWSFAPRVRVPSIEPNSSPRRNLGESLYLGTYPDFRALKLW